MVHENPILISFVVVARRSSGDFDPRSVESPKERREIIAEAEFYQVR